MAAFTVIDHTEIGSGGAASWSVSSIPSSYDHLLIKISARGDRASNWSASYGFRVGNAGLSTSNYSWTRLDAEGTSVGIWQATSQTSIDYERMPGSTATSNTFNSSSIWIPNYANTSNYKQMILDTVLENNSTTSNKLEMKAGLWRSPSAITDVGVYERDGNNFVQYSTFTLYGITNNA